MCSLNEISELAIYSIVVGFWMALGATCAFLVVSHVFNIIDKNFTD